MKLRRDDAAHEQREEQRDRRREDAETPRDETGAEEDRRGDAQQDRGRHGERLGERPPEREPDGGRQDRENESRAHQRAVFPTTRCRSDPPTAPASAPTAMYGQYAKTRP